MDCTSTKPSTNLESCDQVIPAEVRQEDVERRAKPSTNLESCEQIIPAEVRQEDVERRAGAGQAAWVDSNQTL